MDTIYEDLRWSRARSRALARDGHRCTVSRLLGGSCAALPLHVHHIVPVSEGGEPFDLDNLASVCASHHPQWEALRRTLVRRLRDGEQPPRCRHQHRSKEARLICERRLARQRQIAA